MRPLAKVLLPLILTLGLFALIACNKVESIGLYDPNVPEAATPTITGISPAGNAYAGMDTIVIQGTNFSPVLSYNYVYFNSKSAALLSASPTQITLMAPLVTMDSIGVRAAVRGAPAFSNTYRYQLSAGVMVFGGLTAKDSSVALATDAAGNLLAAYCTAGKDAGILKITPSGSQSTFAPATAGVPLWWGLKIGPAGYLFATRNIRALFSLAPAGGVSPGVWLTFPTGTSIADLDFDRDGNIWCGGNNANLYKVDRSKVSTTYPFVGMVRSIRVFNDYLYFAAKTEAGEKIWRAPITAGALGTPEVYWDFGAVYPGNIPKAITFASDGTLFVGTDSQDGLLMVSTNKTVTTPFTAYKSLFPSGIGFLAWGSGDRLYASANAGALLKFSIRGKTSAPYYGSTL